MKVTFIQPYYDNVWEALGIGYIISYVKEYCGEEDLEINFFQGKFDSDDDIVNGSYDSDIVAFSCTSPAYDHGLSLARQIKTRNANVHTVFGGWHPTALPDDVIKRSCVDQVIVGEGELAMCKVILGSRKQIIVGSKETELDEMLWPDRLAIRNDRTIDLCEKMTGQRTASFQLSRGCKVHCKFCSEVQMTGKWHSKNNPIRSRSIEETLDEINYIAYHERLTYFKFVDATFDRDAQTVIDFCKAKVERGMILPWECNIHPNFVQSEEVFDWLKKANCNQINVGVESGSSHILRDIGKGSNLIGIKKVFDWAKTYDIKTRAFFLLGMPNERFSDIEETSQLVGEINPDVVGFTILAPYPGSDFYDAEKHKFVDWSKVDEYSNTIWENQYHNNDELLLYQQMLVNRFHEKLCFRQA